MPEKERGQMRMLAGASLCIVGVLMTLGNAAGTGFAVLMFGLGVMLMGALLSGFGAIADAIRGGEEDETQAGA